MGIEGSGSMKKLMCGNKVVPFTALVACVCVYGTQPYQGLLAIFCVCAYIQIIFALLCRISGLRK